MQIIANTGKKDKAKRLQLTQKTDFDICLKTAIRFSRKEFVNFFKTFVKSVDSPLREGCIFYVQRLSKHARSHESLLTKSQTLAYIRLKAS